MPILRLDKFFSSQEIVSRKDIKPLIKQGAIKINDKIATKQDEKINTEKDKIYLNSKLIEYKPYVYIMLNKPKGYVSATNDTINPTVLDLVPKELFRSDLFPAGRLDKETTGFVLITNDGDFAHNILSPKNHVDKEYIAELDGVLTKEMISLVENGITLADGYVCEKCKVEILEQNENSIVKITLSEGKYHQIKRMFGVVDLGVNELKRISIGNLVLDPNLAEGSCKEILHKELDLILDKK